LRLYTLNVPCVVFAQQDSNSFAEALFGCNAEALHGRDISNLIVPEHRDRLTPLLQRMKIARAEAEIRLKHRPSDASRDDTPHRNAQVSESVQLDMITDDQTRITVDCALGIADSVGSLWLCTPPLVLLKLVWHAFVSPGVCGDPSRRHPQCEAASAIRRGRSKQACFFGIHVP